MRSRRIRRPRNALVVLLAGLASVAGCGDRARQEAPGGEGPAPGDTLPAAGDSAPASAGDTAGTAPGGGALPERPATRTDTILLEGTPELTELTLVRSPAAFEPAFSTYVPEGMVRVFGHPERGMEIRFVAAFGGVRNEEASLGFYFHPPGATEEEVREEARRVAREHGGTGAPEASRRWEWSEAEYAFGDARQARLFGQVAVARHGDRWFRVLLRYPPEYGDGFGPRAALILDRWRWEESGGGLGDGAGG